MGAKIGNQNAKGSRHTLEWKKEASIRMRGTSYAKGMKPNKTSFKKGEHKGIKTEFKKGHIPWMKGLKGFRAGEKNNFWKGGNSQNYKTGYYSTEYKQWRITVFERDGYKCQGCNQVGGYLTAHHIKSFAKYPEFRFDINNGITLCENCHKLTDNYKGRDNK